jgi:hypothetical protein
LPVSWIANKDINSRVDATDLETLRACVAEGLADAGLAEAEEAEDVYPPSRSHRDHCNKQDLLTDKVHHFAGGRMAD